MKKPDKPEKNKIKKRMVDHRVIVPIVLGIIIYHILVDNDGNKAFSSILDKIYYYSYGSKKKRGKVAQPPEKDFGVPSWMTVVGNIKKVDWSDRYDYYGKEAVIFRNNPAEEKWSAFEKWDREFLIERFPKFNKVRKHVDNDKLFVYEANERMMRLWDDDTRGNVLPPRKIKLVNISSREFFDSNESLYFSHFWTKDFADAFGDDLYPLDFLKVDEKEVHLPFVEVLNYFWITKTGTVAGLHYDPAHNLFVQLGGCKRFLITSPKWWNQSYFFPLFHPNDRQSQREIDHQHISNNKLEALVADLHPGDMLYLPPYYGHRVAAFECFVGEDHSISINSWSTSLAQVLVKYSQQKDYQPRILRAKISRKQKLGGMKYYLSKLALKVTTFDLKTLIETGVISQRYLVNNNLANGLNCANWDASKCPTFELDENGEDKEFIQQLDVEIDFMIKLFNDKFPIQDENVKNLLLGDYIERFITLIAGLEVVCPLLRCIATRL